MFGIPNNNFNVSLVFLKVFICYVLFAGIYQQLSDSLQVVNILQMQHQIQTKRSVLRYCVTVSYLLNAIGPALADAIPCPDVVCVLSQSVHHGLLGGRQFDVAQVQRSRFIPAGQLIAARIDQNQEESHLGLIGITYFFIILMLGDLRL